MKILRLRLTNLNSLRGSNALDFTRPPLSNSGLFAITGPTGSGKTTLLDAITLALYGRVARYGKDPSPESVMSRHTGECSAEVEFACAAGCFRSVWQLQRARKRPDGKFQPAKRRVIALPGETVIAESIKDSDTRIQELTGLDYDRFLRSVLLAQGEFAAFLRADARQRTELLQEVTGTEVYQEISRAAFRCSAEAQQRHEALLRELEAVPVLAPDVRASQEAQLLQTRERLADTLAALAGLDKRLADARRRRELEEEARRLARDTEEHARNRELASSGLERLEAHERALPAAADLGALDRLRSEAVREAERQRAIATALPEAERRLGKAEARSREAEASCRAEEARQDARRPLWVQVSALDQDIAALREVLRQAADRKRQLEARHVEASAAHAAERKRRDALALEHRADELWLREHEGDDAIGPVLPDLRAEYERWFSKQAALEMVRRELEEARRDSAALAGRTDEAQKKFPALEAAYLQKRELLAAARNAQAQAGRQGSSADVERLRDTVRDRRAGLDKLLVEAGRHKALLSELDSLKTAVGANGEALARAGAECGDLRQRCKECAASAEALAQALRLCERIQSLESHRSGLQDGLPCPLCGATQHPFADRTQAIAFEVDAARARLTEAEARLAGLRSQLVEAERMKAARETDAERLATSIAKLDTERTALAARLEQTADALGLGGAGIDAEAAGTAVAQAVAEEARLQNLLGEVRSLESASQAAAVAAQEAQAALERAESDLAARRALAAQAALRVHSLEESLAARDQEALKAREALALRLAPFAQLPTDLQDARTAVASLALRSESFAARRHEAEQRLSRLRALEERISGLARRAEETAGAIVEEDKRTATSREAHTVLEKTRRDLLGDLSVDSDQRACEALLRQLRQRFETERAEAEKRRSEHAALIHEDTLLHESQARRAGLREEFERRLEAAAAAAGFVSSEALRGALMPSEDAVSLATARQRLAEAQSVLANRSAALAREMAALPPSATEDASQLEAVLSEKAAQEEARSQLDRTLGALAEVLRNDTNQRERQAAVAGRIAEAHREYARWDRLRALIGSADGSAFARFAQGLTLERLTLLANRHLDQLNPRYSMRRHSGAEAADLDLEIIDHYQADAARPMRSLSGGESFLVSLALALGLSELASGRTTIESLFIDEGFGTLDAETLETAMAALEALQAQGKTIGVISHVPAMQERITTQIRIAKESGGCSSVSVN